uniref:Uncharacterized protein n=1 Tax=Panagrolaimus superbus TaxID=310955 RepID=A0A914Z9X0_9BILA
MYFVQREIIDLARPTGIEEEFSANSTVEITTEKLLETTLESRVTATNGPSTPTIIPTTAAPIVGIKEIQNIRNIPETIANETTPSESTSSSTTTSATTISLEPLKKVTELRKEVVENVEVLTSESPLRAKIVVIPKEILATTDASEISENITDLGASTKYSEILEATTNSPAKKSSSTASESLIPKKSSTEEISVSSEEQKSGTSVTAAAASIPSLRLILRRIFKGE